MYYKAYINCKVLFYIKNILNYKCLEADPKEVVDFLEEQLHKGTLVECSVINNHKQASFTPIKIKVETVGYLVVEPLNHKVVEVYLVLQQVVYSQNLQVRQEEVVFLENQHQLINYKHNKQEHLEM